jgi:hypothetical protein
LEWEAKVVWESPAAVRYWMAYISDVKLSPTGRWGNSGFGRQQNGFGGAKRWEGKSNIGGFSGNIMKGGDMMANRIKPSRFSAAAKPLQPQVGNNYGFGQRIGGENRFSVPPPPPPSGDMNWWKQFSQPPKTNSLGTASAAKTSKPVLSVKELCNVQGMTAPGNINVYSFPPFLNVCAQMQTVQQ